MPFRNARVGAPVRIKNKRVAQNGIFLLQRVYFVVKYTRLESRGVVAQLGERLNGIQEVRGSIPLSSTIKNRRILRFFCCLKSFQNPLFIPIDISLTNQRSVRERFRRIYRYFIDRCVTKSPFIVPKI